MIDTKMKYQASIFGDVSDIKPTPDNTKTLIDLFSDKRFIPNSFQELGASGVKIRLSFMSLNQEWIVTFPSNRIDIERHAIEPQGKNLGELSDFCSEVSNLFERVTKEFKKKANRIALVTNFLLEEMTEETLSNVYLKLFHPPKFYEENPPFEWNWRTVSRKPIDLDGRNETLNVITTINRVQGELPMRNETQLFDRVQLSFDINTTPENKEYRFEPQHIATFYNHALELHNNLLAEVREFING